MKKLFKFAILTVTLLLVAVASVFSQTIDTLANGSVVVSGLPTTLAFPDFSSPGWAKSNEFLALVSTFVTVLVAFLLQLVPKWRKLPFAMVTKVTIVSILAVTMVFSLGGKEAWPAIIGLILNAVGFQSHLLYEAVVKPILGSSTEVAEKMEANTSLKKAKMNGE